MDAALESLLQDLIAKWKTPVSATNDDPAYDAGREMGYFSCAEELKELIDNYRQAERAWKQINANPKEQR